MWRFLSTVLNYDFLLLTETWSNDSENVDIPGFHYFRSNRVRSAKARRDSGGLIFYYAKRHSKGVSVIKNKHEDIMWVKLCKDYFNLEKDLCIALVYLSPANSSRQTHIVVDYFQELIDDVAELQNQGFETIVTGDFNARTSTHPDFVEFDGVDGHVPLPDDYIADEPTMGNAAGGFNHVRASCDKVNPNDYGYKLLDLCKETGLRIVNGRVGSDKGVGNYTCHIRQGSSVVDYLLADASYFSQICNFSVCDNNVFSDHCALSFVISGSSRQQCVALNGFKYYKWKSNMADHFHDELRSDYVQAKFQSMREDDHITAESVNRVVNIFTDTICEAASPLFAKKTGGSQNRRNKPTHAEWYKDCCKERHRLFDVAFAEYKVDKCENKRAMYITARNQYRSHVRRCRRDHGIVQSKRILQMSRENDKQMWKLLKEGTSRVEPNITLNEFQTFFEGISKAPPHLHVDDIVEEELDNYDTSAELLQVNQLDKPITRDEIKKAINSLKTNKSGGSDLIINEFFKTSDILLPELEFLFNLVLNSGFFPESWSNGIIVPIHKKGNINNAQNYRGITLLSCTGKLFTNILNKRLTSWAEEHSHYGEVQAGFRAGYSTTDQIFVLHALVNGFLTHNKKLYAAFVDFQKAFDYVDRSALWVKLIRLGVSSKVLKVLRNMYQSVKSCVRTSEGMSEPFICDVGVRQGESLSPFLFCMYISDMEEELSRRQDTGVTIEDLKMFLLMFADDTTLLAETVAGLQSGLDVLDEYCERWALQVNIDKTKIVVFKKGGRIGRNEQWKYKGRNIDVVNCFKYLGIVFAKSGKFNIAQKTLAEQATKGLFTLKRYTNKFVNLSPEMAVQLFDVFITPILCYGSEVWGFHRADAIERVHLKYLKHTLGVKSSVPNAFVYGEFGRVPMSINRKARILSYWCNLLNQPNSKYSRYMYNGMVREVEEEPGIVNWASSVRDLLYSLGMGEPWLQQSIGCKKLFILEVKQRLRDQFMQTWNADVSGISRARTYKHIKTQFCSELYLSINNRKFMVALAQLRTSAHRLSVETGRWTGVPYASRKCVLCNSDIEDEYHVVLICPHYSDLRKKLLPTYYVRYPSMWKFVSLCTTNNERLLFKLSKLVWSIFERRKVLV